MITALDKACISTQLYDLNGWLYLTGINIKNSSMQDRERRVTRFKTLDGNVYLDDLGFSHGDRTVTLSVKLTESIESILNNIIENHPLIWLSLKDGIFTAAIESVIPKENTAVIRILLKESA